VPTDEPELLLDAERALGGWAIGELTFHEAIQRACGGFALSGNVTCALVYVDGSSLDVIGSSEAERKPELFRRVALVASRDFITQADPRWTGIVRRDVDLIPGRTPWIACEPVIHGPSMVQSVLVIIGSDESPRDLALSSLIRLARWTGAVLAQERVRITRAHLLQRVRHLCNGLREAIGEAIGDESRSEQQASPATRHARDLADQLLRQVGDLEKVGTKH